MIFLVAYGGDQLQLRIDLVHRLHTNESAAKFIAIVYGDVVYVKIGLPSNGSLRLRRIAFELRVAKIVGGDRCVIDVGPDIVIAQLVTDVPRRNTLHVGTEPIGIRLVTVLRRVVEPKRLAAERIEVLLRDRYLSLDVQPVLDKRDVSQQIGRWIGIVVFVARARVQKHRQRQKTYQARPRALFGDSQRRSQLSDPIGPSAVACHEVDIVGQRLLRGECRLDAPALRCRRRCGEGQ